MLRPVRPRLTPASARTVFLDVIVPKAVWDNASSVRKPDRHSGAPVVVWIHGGGYTYGEKSVYGPAGLIKASQVSGNPGIIFVPINYRVSCRSLCLRFIFFRPREPFLLPISWLRVLRLWPFLN